MDNQEKFTYYAFISYQRKDEKWAKWLQRKLENYKLPVANAKGSSENKSKYIRPVFRDKTDLTAGSLPDALKEALAQSRYLIVICSPNAVESPWVNEEIDTFTNAGRTEYIIPFIVDGEPYSKENIKECFPEAIRTIPKEKEPLGVNVKDGGRNQAFIRTVAYMLGVKFDELWNRYERHRKKIRNFSIACLSILMLLAIGLSDYLRTKVEYYADWVDCYGVAQGVTPLDIEQVRHRNVSYKFEYKRIPFGEKGFYSWRLKRVSLVNSKGVISNSTPDNYAFFYPVQEYKYTDGYLTEIINSDSYNRVTMRYSIKDDYEHNVACLVDIEGKEKHQGSAFLSSSTTALLSGENSSSTMSKIKRFHYTRDDKGHIIKVTYHANDAEELDESAIGDNNNIYGKLFELDSLGRVRKVSYINHEGEPMTDKFGVGHIQYSYGQFGGRDTIEYLGADRNLAYNEQKFARRITQSDQYGNSIEEYFNGVDGQPCFNYQNIYHTVVKYDINGNMVELRYYDFDGMPSYCSDNFSIQRANYDSMGRWVEVFHYDVNDVPCYTKNNYSIARVKYNTRDCIIERRVYDINDDPCLEMATGLHMTQIKYDSYNYETEFRFYNEFEKLMVSPILHWAKSSNTYNDYHQVISVKYFDEKGTLCFSNEFVCEIQRYFDSRGNLIKEECYDAEGRPCISKEGYATLKIKYDNYGNRIEESYFGVNGEPIYINMCSLIQFDYYNNGLLKESRYYDTDGKLCLNNDWYAIERLEYDTNGNITKASYFDSDSCRCIKKEGLFSVMNKKRDKNGNVIREEYYGTDMELCNTESNRAFTYDTMHRIVSESFFAKDEVSSLCKDGWHSCRLTYDSRGNVIGRNYYDIKNKPCNNSLGYAIEENYYDDNNQLIKVVLYDNKGNITNDVIHGCAIQTIIYDGCHRVIERSFFNKNGVASWYDDYKNGQSRSFSKVHYIYDERNNVIESQYYSPDGALTMAAGHAVEMYKYDNLNRIIQEDYLDENRQPCIGFTLVYSSCKKKYNNLNLLSEKVLYNSSNKHIQTMQFFYNSLGLEVEERYLDESGNLIPSSDMMALGAAKIVCEYNTMSLLARMLYYDQNDEIADNSDGYAEKRNTYDMFGRITMLEYYDKLGGAAESISKHYHRQILSYNNRGEIEKESYYLSDGFPAIDTPWGYSKATYEYNLNGERTHYYQYLGDVMIYDSDCTIDESKLIDVIFVRTELPGQFIDDGLLGTYYLLEWNDWSADKDVIKFSEEFAKSKDKPKHLLLCKYNFDDGINSRLGEVIEKDFDEQSLGVRIMSLKASEDEHRLLLDLLHTYRNSR